MKASTVPVLYSAIARRSFALAVALALLCTAGFAGLLLLAGVPAAAMQSAALETALPTAALLLGGSFLFAMAATGGVARRGRELLEAAERLAGEDFSARAPDRGGDEIARAGAGVNAFARSMATRIQAQQLVEQLDEVLLARAEPANLMRMSLRALRHLGLGELALIGMFESPSSEVLRVYSVHRDEKARVNEDRVQIARATRRDLDAAKPGVPVENPLPAPFLEPLQQAHGLTSFACFALVHPGGCWGVLVLGGTQPVQPTAAQVGLMGKIGARLVFGYHAAERERRLLDYSRIDAVTGLPNQFGLLHVLRENLAGQDADGGRMSALLRLEIPRIHLAGEALGTPFQEELVRRVAGRLRSELREGEVIARIGADEFVVLLEDIQSPREAGAAARRMVQALLRRVEFSGHGVCVGGSVGIALHPADGRKPEEILQASRVALERARAEGGDRFAFYEEPMNLELRRRSELESELRTALEKDQFVLQYQPQFDLNTGLICGAEALVRWRHPVRGLLAPGEFLALAGESGLADDIGDWVFARACESNQRWRDLGVDVPRLALNATRGQLLRVQFIERLRALMERTGLGPGALEIEITETMLVEGGEPLEKVLHAIHELGVRVAIDDFGTGLTSFSRLGQLPVQVIKTDMSFLLDATQENDAGRIVAALVRMAHALGKEVVAEGVERVEQLKLLKQLGCERGQGFLFGRIVEEEQIVRMFRRRSQTAPATVPAAPATSATVPD